jgi:AraC-like DNA-binding protein/mannose-6-phosphate isomerase-like protein (cupin superfamily)
MVVSTRAGAASFAVASWHGRSNLGRVPRPRLVECSLMRPVPPWPLAAHTHDVHELIVVRSGTYRAAVDGRVVACAAGECFHTAPGVRHEPRFTVDGRLRFWCVQWRGGAPWPGHHCFTDHGHRLALACDWMWSLMQRRDHRDQGALDGLIEALVHQAQLAPGGRTHDAPTARVLLFLEHNCDQRLTLAQLAEVAGESVWALLRRFRREVGVPPMRMQKRCRVAWAERLIAQGMRPGDAARRVGYAGIEQLAKARRSV